MGKKMYVAHNFDVQRPDDQAERKGATKTVRIKAGTIATDLSKEEIESGIALGSIRPATPDEEESVDAQERAAKMAEAQAEHDQERSQLAREHASARSAVEKKHDKAKADELAKLEEQHAKEREAKDKELAKKLAPAGSSGGKK